MTFFVANVVAKAMADVIDDQINEGTGAGKLKIYAGTVPADADTALGAQTLLATLTFSDPAFGAAADATPGATITASAITADSSADATGTATFFRITDSDDEVKAQGSVTATGGGGDLTFNTVSFVSTAEISVTSFTITVPESAS